MQHDLSDGRQVDREKLLGELSNPRSSFHFLHTDNMLSGYLKLNEPPAQSDLNDPNSLEQICRNCILMSVVRIDALSAVTKSWDLKLFTLKRKSRLRENQIPKNALTKICGTLGPKLEQ